MTDFFRYSGVVFVLLFFLLFSSCSDSGNEETEISQLETIETIVSEESVVETVSPRGLITFLTGEVFHSSNGIDRIPEIGDPIEVGDELKTGFDGYIELQFGNLAVLRIQSESIYRLDSAELNKDSENVSGFLGVGSLIAKIRHLTNKDGFEVDVPGAVCAVRGTEFLIRADKNGSVTIAVADGSVAVSPPSMAGVGNDTDKSLFAIQSLMPLVTANKELVITPETLANVEQELISYQAGASDDKDVDILKTRIQEIVTEVPLPEPDLIDPVNAELLEEDTPEILTVVYSSNSDELSDLPSLVTLTVTTLPADTSIFINNRPVGRGNVSQVFTEGSAVHIKAVSSDGQSQEKELSAGAESLVNFVFDDPDPEPEIPVTEVPVETNLESKSESESLNVSVAVPSAPEKVTYQVTTQPADALISFNGQPSGTGSGEYEGNPGDLLTINVERPGYERFTRNLTLRTGTPSLRVRLDAQPIVSKSRLPDIPAAGSLVSNGNIVVGATGQGTVFAVNRNGRLLWSRATRNRDAENISPVIAGNKVYIIGNAELAIININDGSLLARRELSGDQADLFGRRVLAWNKYLVLPSDSSLIFINPKNGPENGKIVDSIIIPGGSRMTPAIWNNQIITADQRGTLLYIDPESKSIIRTVPTESSQPVGQAPAIRGDIAVFSGRRGEVTAVNLRRAEVIWEQMLDENSSIRVHTDALISSGIVYLYGKGTLYAMNLTDGRRPFPPITGVSAPPEVLNGVLYLCRENGIISMHNQHNGSFIGEFLLNEISRARPAGLGPFLVVASEENVFILDPRSMTD